MSLVTDISPEELAALQAEMQSPANVERLTKKFTEAFQPAFVPSYKEPLAADSLTDLMDRPTEIYGHCWSGLGEFPDGTEVVELPYEGSGFLMCKVYHRDPKRHEKAKTSQPSPGERPTPVSNDNMILRMDDGSLVNQTKGRFGVSTRRLT